MSCSGRGGLEQVPDAAGEVALEAADGFFCALAFGAFAVDGRVDLAVAATVEAVAVGLAGADRDRSDAGSARELGVCGEPARAGDLSDELGRGQRTETWLGKQLRRDLGDEL